MVTGLGLGITASAKVTAAAATAFDAAVYDTELSTDVVDNLMYTSSGQIDFAGFNSSDEPVFVSVWNDSARSNVYAMLWSIDGSDGTITTGTKYTAATDAGDIIYPDVCTERSGGNLRQDLTVSDHCVIGWRNLDGNYVNAIAASYSLDALTMSFGSVTTFSNALEADGMVEIDFAGTSGEYICITRSVSNNTPKFSRIDRSGTTLSVGIDEDTIELLGGYEFSSSLGFKDDRAMIVASHNNRDLQKAQFAKFDNTDTLRGIEYTLHEGNETNSRGAVAPFNATDSYLHIRWETQVSPTNTQVEGGVINWNGSGSTLPSLTKTNQIEVEATNTTGALGAAAGAADGEAYVWKETATASNYDLWKFTLSGTTITESYEKTFSHTINFSGNPELGNVTAKDSNDNFFIASIDRNTANGYPAVRVIVNPDSLT
jgi:hypothetical protein